MASETVLQKDRPIEAMLEHEVRMRAYALYEQRGKADGHALDDWLKAEAEALAALGDTWGLMRRDAGLSSTKTS